MKNVFATLLIIVLLGVIGLLSVALYQKSQLSSPLAADTALPEPGSPAAQPQDQPAPSPVPASQTPPGQTKSNQGTQFTGQIFYNVLFNDDTFDSYKQYYTFIKKGKSSDGFTWYVAAAGDADITVKDASGKIIGLFNAVEDGRFDFNAPKADFYELEILYRNTKRTVKMKAGETTDKYIYYGIYDYNKQYFKTGGSFGGSELLNIVDQ